MIEALLILSPVIFSALGIPLRERAKATMTTMGTLVSALRATLLFMNQQEYVLEYPWIQNLGLSLSIHVTDISKVMGLLVSWLVFLIAVYSIKYMQGDYRPGWYWFMFGFFATSMLIIVYASNLWFLLVGWEGVGLASWALIGHWYRDERDKWVGDERHVLGTRYWWTPSRAGLRAILTVRIGDAFFIIALAYIFSSLGTLDIFGLREAEWSSFAGWALPALFLFLVMGPLTKSAQFPFHEWLLTAMTGPTSVSALIHAATMVKAGIYVLVIISPMMLAALSTSPMMLTVFYLLLVLGLITAVLTTVMALASGEFKLVLANSTAANLGLMTASIGASGVLYQLTGNYGAAVFPIAAALAHIIGHAVSKASLFMGFGAVIHEAGTRFIYDVSGLYRYMRVTAIAMFLAMFSLMGIPPFLGFFTKEMALASIGIGAAIYGAALVSFLTPIYGLRLLGLTFLGEPRTHVHEASPLMWAPYMALALAGIPLGLLWPIGGEKGVEEAVALYLRSADIYIFETAMYIPLLFLVLGVALGAYLYAVRHGVELVGGWRTFWRVAYDRFYLPVLYDRVIGGGFILLSRALYAAVDVRAFDAFYHKLLPGAFGSLSVLFRAMQLGRVNLYIVYILLGIIMAGLIAMLI